MDVTELGTAVGAFPGAPFPGAQPPDRERTVDAAGVALAVHEWGSATDPPLLFAHGGSDFARTIDVFAPLLVAGGWRVVAWDQRGHGDSARADLYNIQADIRDALAVARSTSSAPMPFVGHSKGSMVLLELAAGRPDLLSAFVSLDGLPPSAVGKWAPDVNDSERGRLQHSLVVSWLDTQRRVGELQRRPGTVTELARRRKKMNPRLPMEWLEHLVTVGGTESADGWRWKLDAGMRPGLFGVWRPQWLRPALAGLDVPTLGVLGLELEPMGWGTRPDDVRDIMPPGSRLVPLPDTGHFVHIERPAAVADLVLDFLA